MTENHEQPQITGKQLRDLRHKQGLSHLTFARKLGVPVWLVEMLEQERVDASDQLAQLIPETMRSDFYQLLLKAYGQPKTWFTVASGHSAQKPSMEGTELTLHLPITVSPQMAMDWIDMIMLLICEDVSYADQKKRCVSYLVSSLMQLHQLYCHVWRAQGEDHIAQNNIMLLKDRICQKIKELEEK